MVRFENVGLRYGLGPEILRDLSFMIPAHSFQFLTGPSGAGKTSLLRLLFLSLRPTRGLVNLFGKDVSLLSKDQVADLRKRIGIVLQDFRLLDHMTTYENVALPFRVMGREESTYRREVIDLLKWVGLGERMDALPPILSGAPRLVPHLPAPANGGAPRNPAPFVVRGVATSIAAAVEEQGAATQEIVRNVAQASVGTAAGDVLSNARELDTQSGMLRSAVDEFLQKVRAA